MLSVPLHTYSEDYTRVLNSSHTTEVHCLLETFLAFTSGRNVEVRFLLRPCLIFSSYNRDNNNA